MNRTQRWALVGGLLLVFLAGLFPPNTKVIVYPGDNLYETAGRCFLVAPKLTRKGRIYYRIDYYRVALECLTIAALTGAVFLIAHKRGV